MNNKMLRFDMHCHTSGVSRCAKKNMYEVINDKIKEGYQGIVLTNHIQPWYYNNYKEYRLEIDKQINEFNEAKQYGETKNFKVIFGIEVSIQKPFYGDFLLYGINEKFLQNSTILCEFDQKALFDLCKDNNIKLIQAHPFRVGHQLMNIDYLHGIELNCNTDIIFTDEILKINRQNNKVLTVGTDYHGSTKTLGGIYLPEDINNAEDLSNYLSKTNTIKFFINNKDFTFIRQ